MIPLMIVEDNTQHLETALDAFNDCKNDGKLTSLQLGECDLFRDSDTFREILRKIQNTEGDLALVLDVGLNLAPEDIHPLLGSRYELRFGYVGPKNELPQGLNHPSLNGGTLLALGAMEAVGNEQLPLERVAIVFVSGQDLCVKAFEFVEEEINNGQFGDRVLLADKHGLKSAQGASSAYRVALLSLEEAVQRWLLHSDPHIARALEVFSTPWRNTWKPTAKKQPFLWSHEELDLTQADPDEKGKSRSERYRGLLANWLGMKLDDVDGDSAKALAMLSETGETSACKHTQQATVEEAAQTVAIHREPKEILTLERTQAEVKEKWVGTWKHWPKPSPLYNASKAMKPAVLNAVCRTLGISNEDVVDSNSIGPIRLPILPSLPFFTSLRQLVSDLQPASIHIDAFASASGKFFHLHLKLKDIYDGDREQFFRLARIYHGRKLTEGEDLMDQSSHSGFLEDFLWCRTAGIVDSSPWYALFSNRDEKLPDGRPNPFFLPAPPIGMLFAPKHINFFWG